MHLTISWTRRDGYLSSGEQSTTFRGFPPEGFNSLRTLQIGQIILGLARLNVGREPVSG